MSSPTKRVKLGSSALKARVVSRTIPMVVEMRISLLLPVIYMTIAKDTAPRINPEYQITHMFLESSPNLPH